MNKPGATMIELLVYLSITTVITLISLSLLHESHRYFSIHMSDNNRRLDLSVAQDVFVRDVARASTDSSTWKMKRPTLMVWQCGDKDVGWSYAHNTLVRIVGSYDADADQWKQATKSSVMRGLKECTFEADTRRSGGSDRIVGVEMDIDYGGHRQTCYGAVRNGIEI